MSYAGLTPARDFDTTTTILLSQPNTILVDALPELVECHILLQPACALWIFNANAAWCITLVERSSRFVMLVRVGGKDTESVVCALGEQIRRLPRTMMATLTWDRGPEMAAHKKFTVATDVSVYFCDPKSFWQRGTSENTNRLLRQYLPRRTDLSVYDQADLELIALKLNTRPRETLGYDTPAATLAKAVALLG
jgi:IS30 family transposase